MDSEEWNTTLFLTFSLQKGPNIENRRLKTLKVHSDFDDNYSDGEPRGVDDMALSHPQWKGNVEKLG